MAGVPSQSFVPALDGLRGIAILLVVLSHATLYRPEEGVDSVIAALPLFGWVGVDLFFVLSGFLITGILIDSRDSSSYYSTFYARRALRIFPLYYLVLAVALLLLPMLPELHRVIVGPYPVPPQAPYWLYFTNFSIVDRGMVHGWLDVAWSLAIEEQFYIVWAVVVLLMPPRYFGWLCLAILLIEPIARTVALNSGVRPESVYVLTWFRLDGLSMGALLAWLQRRGQLPSPSKATRVAAAVTAGGLLLIIFEAGDSWWWNPRMQQVGYSLTALGGAFMLISALRERQGWWSWLLTMGWLRAFGKYSYCLYLTHLPVMRLVREYVFEPREFNHLFPTPWLAQLIFYLLAIAPAFLLARISWAVFEEPILRLKAKFPYQPARAALDERQARLASS